MINARTSIFAIVAVLAVVAHPALAAEPCVSCADCQAKLTSGLYETVELANDIIEHEGTCIDLDHGPSNVEFDCAGHVIDGDGLSVSPVRGIAMRHATGNMITGCVITDFYSAIYLVDTTGIQVVGNLMLNNNVGIDLLRASGGTVTGNEVRDSYSGIKFSSSDDNVVDSNVFCHNDPWDVYFASGTGNEGFDNTCYLTWYWSDVGVDGCTFTCYIFTSGFEYGDFTGWTVSGG